MEIHKITQVLITQECYLCNGSGKIMIYRNDLEEFEEVNCIICSKDESNIKMRYKKGD